MEPNEPLQQLFATGSFNGGVFDTLKTSARNSKLMDSRIRNVFPIIKSAFCRPGPRMGLRELVPITNWLAVVKAAVLKYFATVRPAKSLGLPILFGLCTAKPRPELL